MLFIIMDKSSKNIELNGQFYIHILGAMLKNQSKKIGTGPNE